MNQTEIWIKDPRVLYKKGNCFKIIPTSQMTKAQKLNSLTRLFILILILLLLFSFGFYFALGFILGLILVTIIIVFFMSKSKKSKQNLELIDTTDKEPAGFYSEVKNTEKSKQSLVTNQDSNPNPFSKNNAHVCQEPSINNPYMNLTLVDLMDNTGKLPACSAENKKIRSKINNLSSKFDNNNISEKDFFDKNYAQRSFYTMPVTTIINDQTGFAQWLSEGSESCKENQLKCLKYENVKYQRSNSDF